MSNKSVEFGQMLTEAIHTIKACEGKSIQLIQDEMGDELGRKGGSAVVRWRAGHLPPTVADVERISRLVHERTQGRMSRKWHERFLSLGRYPTPNTVLDELFSSGTELSELKAEQKQETDSGSINSPVPSPSKPQRMNLPLMLGGLLVVALLGFFTMRLLRQETTSPNEINKQVIIPSTPFDLLDVDNFVLPDWCATQSDGQVVIERDPGGDLMCYDSPLIGSSVGDFRVDYEFSGYGGALTAQVGRPTDGYWAALSQTYGHIHVMKLVDDEPINLGEGMYDSEPYQQMDTAGSIH